MQSLDAPLDAAHRPVFFGGHEGGQHDVGDLRRLRQEGVLNHQEGQASARGLPLCVVRAIGCRIGRHHVQDVDLSPSAGLHDLGSRHPRLRGDRAIPHLLEVACDIGERATAGTRIRQQPPQRRPEGIPFPPHHVDRHAKTRGEIADRRGGVHSVRGF